MSDIDVFGWCDYCATDLDPDTTQHLIPQHLDERGNVYIKVWCGRDGCDDPRNTPATPEQHEAHEKLLTILHPSTTKGNA